MMWTGAVEVWVARRPRSGATSVLILIQTSIATTLYFPQHRHIELVSSTPDAKYSPSCTLRRFRPTRPAPHQRLTSTSGGLGGLASHERTVTHGHVLSRRQVVRPWRSFRSHPKTAAGSVHNGSIDKRRIMRTDTHPVAARLSGWLGSELAWISPAGTNATKTHAFHTSCASV